jgi:hypothetical protein
MSVAQIDVKVNRKKIDRIEAKAGEILVTLVDAQVLRFFADKGKVEVEIVGETKPLTEPK